MASIRSIFNLETPYKEDEEKFYRFINNTVPEFFSNVGNVRYNVPYLLVRSTINEGRVNYQGAKHRKIWYELSNTISHIQHNSKYSDMHKAEIFKFIHDSSNGSYQRMMNLIKKFIDDFEREDKQFNVVKYEYLDRFSQTGRFFK